MSEYCSYSTGDRGYVGHKFTASELAVALGRARALDCSISIQTFDTGPRESGHLFIIIIVILDAGYKTQAKEKKNGTTTTIEKIVLGENRSGKSFSCITTTIELGRSFPGKWNSERSF